MRSAPEASMDVASDADDDGARAVPDPHLPCDVGGMTQRTAVVIDLRLGRRKWSDADQLCQA